MTNKNDLTIIIPCYNEEESIPNFFPDLIKVCNDNKWNIVAINDGSNDKTEQLLCQFNINENFNVISHKVNIGYGGAVKTGILNTSTDYCLTIDADGQHDAADIDKLYKSILKHDGDMVIGSRRKYRSVSSFRGIGKWIIRNFAKIFMKLDIYDINTGLRIFSTELGKKYIHLLPDKFPFCDIITLVFIHKKHLVYEEDISVRKRKGGKSTIGIHTAFDTIMEILNIAVLFNPMKLFLPISFLFLIFGIIWAIYMLSLGKGVSVGSSLLILVGLIIFLLGLIAEQLSKIRENAR